MDWNEFNAVNRLQELLGPTPIHPWNALIPQLLVWSFRRFCIDRILQNEEGASLLDAVWEDLFDLIAAYAPKGLQNVTSSWLTPENIAILYSPLEAYNAYFMDLLRVIDVVLKGDDETLQEGVSTFLDEGLPGIFSQWLERGEGEASAKAFLIFPQTEEQDAEFTDMQFMRLIQALLKYTRASTATPANSRKNSEAVGGGGDGPASVLAPAPLQIPVVADDFTDIEPLPEVAQPPLPHPPLPHPQEPSPPPPTTVTEAIQRRKRTYRRHGHRANRGSTLRSTRIRQKTRKHHPSLK